MSRKGGLDITCRGQYVVAGGSLTITLIIIMIRKIKIQNII